MFAARPSSTFYFSAHFSMCGWPALPVWVQAGETSGGRTQNLRSPETQRNLSFLGTVHSCSFSITVTDLGPNGIYYFRTKRILQTQPQQISQGKLQPINPPSTVCSINCFLMIENFEPASKSLNSSNLPFSGQKTRLLNLPLKITPAISFI